MKNNYEAFDLASLELLYEQEETKLKTTILEGASWEIVAELRKTVTELATAIHQRLYSLSNRFNPAEAMYPRTDEGNAPS